MDGSFFKNHTTQKIKITNNEVRHDNINLYEGKFLEDFDCLVEKINIKNSPSVAKRYGTLIKIKRHPNILRMLGTQVKEHENEILIAFDHQECQLAHVRGSLAPQARVYVTRGIFNATLYLHRMNINFEGKVSPWSILFAHDHVPEIFLSHVDCNINVGSKKSVKDVADIQAIAKIFLWIACRVEVNSIQEYEALDCQKLLNKLENMCQCGASALGRLLLSPYTRHISQLMGHPFFWNATRRLSFIRDSSDILFGQAKKKNRAAFDILGQINKHFVKCDRWNLVFTEELIKECKKQRMRILSIHEAAIEEEEDQEDAMEEDRKDSIESRPSDLLRFMRNLISHRFDHYYKFKYDYLSSDVGLANFLQSKFPKFLMQLYWIVGSSDLIKDILECYFKDETEETLLLGLKKT